MKNNRILSRFTNLRLKYKIGFKLGFKLCESEKFTLINSEILQNGRFYDQNLRFWLLKLSYPFSFDCFLVKSLCPFMVRKLETMFHKLIKKFVSAKCLVLGKAN